MAKQLAHLEYQEMGLVYPNLVVKPLIKLAQTKNYIYIYFPRFIYQLYVSVTHIYKSSYNNTQMLEFSFKFVIASVCLMIDKDVYQFPEYRGRKKHRVSYSHILSNLWHATQYDNIISASEC